MVRPAEIRDLADIETLFLQLCRYLAEHGQGHYQKDYREFRNGVMWYICQKIGDKDTLVLVSETSDGQVKGFLIGRLIPMEPFYEHKLMGRTEWLYPFSPLSLCMYRKFESWAKQQGATIVSNDVLTLNTRATRVMEHYGMKPKWQVMVKEY